MKNLQIHILKIIIKNKATLNINNNDFFKDML